MEGRLPNTPHQAQPEEDREVPTVLMDYAFLKKTGDDKSLVILVMKDRDSRIVMADVVVR